MVGTPTRRVMDMSFEDDQTIIAEQERLLVFPRFDGNDAWRVAGVLRDLARANGEAVALEIQIAGHVLIRHAMPGVQPVTSDWIRRKGNVALRFHRSSYSVGLALAAESTDIHTKYGLPEADFAAHGGAIPLRIAGTGVVGVAVVSALPQRRDHSLMAAALAGALGVAIPELSAA